MNKVHYSVLRYSLAIVLWMIASPLAAQENSGGTLVSQNMDSCADQFFKGKPPITQTSDKVSYICFHQYGVMDSAATKGPLWSGEHLNSFRVQSAKTIPRKNKFHSEKALDQKDRATLSDYLGSHYDRGHMSPNDDMGTPEAQFDSFSLANMVPQNPCNNEIIWKAIETSVRDYVLAHGDVYVITGPIFNDKSLTIGNDVHVPTNLFKVVYDPHANTMIVLVTENKNVQTYQTITIDQLKQWTGVDPVPAATNVGALVLPSLPNLSGSCKKE